MLKLQIYSIQYNDPFSIVIPLFLNAAETATGVIL